MSTAKHPENYETAATVKPPADPCAPNPDADPCTAAALPRCHGGCTEQDETDLMDLLKEEMEERERAAKEQKAKNEADAKDAKDMEGLQKEFEQVVRDYEQQYYIIRQDRRYIHDESEKRKDAAKKKLNREEEEQLKKTERCVDTAYEMRRECGFDEDTLWTAYSDADKALDATTTAYEEVRRQFEQFKNYLKRLQVGTEKLKGLLRRLTEEYSKNHFAAVFVLAHLVEEDYPVEPGHPAPLKPDELQERLKCLWRDLFEARKAQTAAKLLKENTWEAYEKEVTKKREYARGLRERDLLYVAGGIDTSRRSAAAAKPAADKPAADKPAATAATAK